MDALKDDEVTPAVSAFIDQFQDRFMAFLQRELGKNAGAAELGAVMVMLWHSASTVILNGKDKETWSEMCADAFADAERTVEEFREQQRKTEVERS